MRQKAQGIDPPALPPLVGVFKGLGVDAVHVAEFHGDGHPDDPGPVRLAELDAMFAECRRISDDQLLVIPGEEANLNLGFGGRSGHWLEMFPRPVRFTMKRAEGQPFEQDGVYHLRDAADVLELLHRERGLAWTAHPRIKASNFAPDIYKDAPFFRDPNWLGAAWKAMPADLSRPRLGDRCLDLLDAMSNWGRRKQLLGEVDVFKLDSTHELYAHMNINYVKLDRIPRFDEGWQPILDALRGGRFCRHHRRGPAPLGHAGRAGFRLDAGARVGTRIGGQGGPGVDLPAPVRRGRLGRRRKGLPRADRPEPNPPLRPPDPNAPPRPPRAEVGAVRGLGHRGQRGVHPADMAGGQLTALGSRNLTPRRWRVNWSVANRVLGPLVGMVMLLSICLAAIALLRWTGLSKPDPRTKNRPASPWTWAILGYALLTALIAARCKRLYLQDSGPAAVGLFLVLLLVVPAVGLMAYFLIRRDWTLARVRRRALQGDRNGAIAELRDAIGRRPPRGSAPPPSPLADPWTPPQTGLPSDKPLADRLNVLGTLLSQGDEWASALALFRQAEEVGGPNPFYQGNIGLALVKLGHDREGFAALRAAIAGMPEPRPIDRYPLALVLANTLIERDQRDEAQAALDFAHDSVRGATVWLPSSCRRIDREFETVRARLSSVAPADLDARGDRD